MRNQCGSSIVINASLWDVIVEEAMNVFERAAVYRNSLVSAQLCCELKTVLSNKIKKKKSHKQKTPVS